MVNIMDTLHTILVALVIVGFTVMGLWAILLHLGVYQLWMNMREVRQKLGLPTDLTPPKPLTRKPNHE